MISNARVFERKRFLSTFRPERFSCCDYFYPFARQGLYFYLKDKKYKTVLLPSYVAEGVFDPFKRLGYTIEFYDTDENGNIQSGAFAKQVDVFVYIHYFGLYNERNMSLILQNRKKFDLFIEDFSHVVYSEELNQVGDIALFSFTKIFGVTEGSCLRFASPRNEEAIYFERHAEAQRLRQSLYWGKMLESYCGNFKLRGWLTRALRWVGVKDYYSLLMKSYVDNHPRMSAAAFYTLSRLDMERVRKIRKQYSAIYLTGLHPDLLFKVPKVYYERQALFAFPIKVNKRDLFIKQLKEEGVLALTLTNRWWFNEQGDKSMYYSHLLLPINHYLSEREIRTVIDKVNKVFIKTRQDEYKE